MIHDAYIVPEMRTVWSALGTALAGILVTGTLMVIPATTASASGWGGGDNPDWNNTATGINDGNRCAGWTNRSMTGTLTGQDGLAVNATIGFDFRDAQDRNIDLASGCVTSGYSTIVQLNHYVSGVGARAGSMQYDAQGQAKGAVNAGWSLQHLPANVTNVWIETYVRAYTGSPCGMGCAGNASLGKYGWTNRRQVKIVYPQPVLRLVAATTPRFGGSTGAIEVTLANLQGQKMDYQACNGTTIKRSCLQLHAWSTATPEGQILQGWGAGGKIGTAYWRLDSLASGQPYKVRFAHIGANGLQVATYQGMTRSYPGYVSKLTVRTP
jgi:hypothetical protein